MKNRLLMSFVVVAGCVGGPELEEGVHVSPIGGDPEQGRHILGSLADRHADAYRHFRVRGTAIKGADNYDVSLLPAGPGGVDGSNLTATNTTAATPETFSRDDARFEGMVFDGVTGGHLRIVDVTAAPADSVAPSARYFLEYSDDNSTWVPYCAGGGGAVALQGEYDLSRIHHRTGSITFACDGEGVAAKCDTWGYVAGNVGPTSIDWKHHQACTGMANAAYCGNGIPFTRELTPIRIRDFRPDYANPAPDDLGHPVQMPGDPDTFYVEAGWNELGRPVCLAKIRWVGLPPNPCPGVLPDPRFDRSAEAFFCDDLPAIQLWQKGAVLVNGSKMMDAPLQHWRNPSTGDDVATIRGFYIDRDGAPGPDRESTLPFTDYSVYLGNDGMLLRNLPGTIDPAMMVPLYMQAVGNDRYISAKVPPVAAQPATFEGYSFSSATMAKSLTPLYLCTPSTGVDLNTTVGPVVGCSSVTSLRYAMPAP